jgi:hypothetical protein
MSEGLVTFHVRPLVGGAWMVVTASDGQAASTHVSKLDAVAAAKHLARTHRRGEVIVHAEDGAIETAYRHEEPTRRTG